MSIPLRVRHWVASQTIPLSEFILSQQDGGTESFISLLDLGAIYLNQKRCSVDQILNPGDYVRVHVSPKRFPAPSFSFEDCVIAREPDFFVINKPQGYPCHPMVDNIKENLLVFFENHFGEKLFLTHRLDTGTAGVWLLARNAEFQKSFNRMLQEKKTRKVYRARVAGACELESRQVHYMRNSAHSPRVILAEPEPEAQRCELEILSRTQGSSATDLQIRLITGRTHQIRAQLSYCGHPILGDALYGGAKILGDKWALVAESLEFETADRSWNFTLSENQILKVLNQFGT